VNPFTSPIDYIMLAGQRSPGLADLPQGASAPRKWDLRKGYGLSGGGIVYTGDDLAKFPVKIRLYTDQDWTDWDSFKTLVRKPPPNVKPKAMDIWHPILEEFEIKSVVVEDLKGPTQTGDGEWTWEIDFLQFRAPKVAIAKPTASVTKPPPPKTANEILIERLTGQVQELAR
jgi:hypothetical protein